MGPTISVDVVIAEIGSTTTVVSAVKGVNTARPEILGQGLSQTTAAGAYRDVTVGLGRAMEALERTLGAPVEYSLMLAASSAAGGLRMTVHGLVPDMTARAAREAALGAGAVVKLVTCGRLTDADCGHIARIRPNIIMLAGGVDFGESATALYNARRIMETCRDNGVEAPVVYAGNRACRDEIAQIFDGSGQRLYMTDNVYPRIDELNVEDARSAIQDVFERHITEADGMAHVREMVNGGIVPTPGAVMAASRLLYEELGDLLTLDIGGATTDVHSVTEGSPEYSRIAAWPEPFAKRTVEGDLGVFVNAGNILDIVGWDGEDLGGGIDARAVLAGYDGIPKNAEEAALAIYLARKAAVIAVGRHAGRLRHMYGPSGRVTAAEGKDLSKVGAVIGTGGVLTRLNGGTEVMRAAVTKKNAAAMEMLPDAEHTRFYVDKGYIMASMGVLAQTERDTALRLLKRSMGI